MDDTEREIQQFFTGAERFEDEREYRFGVRRADDSWEVPPTLTTVEEAQRECDRLNGKNAKAMQTNNKPLVRRAPVTGRIQVITEYERDGLGELLPLDPRHVHDIEDEVAKVIWERLTAQSPDLTEILDCVEHGWYTEEDPISEKEQVQVHHFLRRLRAIEQGYRAQSGEPPSHVDTNQID